jgi:TonB family protein
MAYAILVSAALAGVAALGDSLARRRHLPSRFLWVSAIALVLPMTAYVMLVPRAVQPVTRLAPSPAEGTVLASSSAPAVEQAASWLPLADSMLSAAWGAATLLLLILLGIGQWRVARTRRTARRGTVLGHAVLLTDDVGPAVAGVAEPVVLVPPWVAALDEPSQRLLLAHELEHARWRDTSLLLGGAAATALLPWNPVVWWLAWRLRVATELDCDRRVLAAYPGVRRYVDLLLLAAARPRLSARLLAAHFGEHASDLQRRIEAMTDTRPGWRPMLLTALATGLLIGAACEAPRPDPVAPGAIAQEANTYFEYQVETPVTMATGSDHPRYPDILREAGVEGEVLVSFVVDETGLADVSTFKVLRSTHELFAMAVKNALPAMRFVPAVVGGRPVRQVVQQPFSFAIEGLPASRRRTTASGENPGTPEVEVRRSTNRAPVPEATMRCQPWPT